MQHFAPIEVAKSMRHISWYMLNKLPNMVCWRYSRWRLAGVRVGAA